MIKLSPKCFKGVKTNKIAYFVTKCVCPLFLHKEKYVNVISHKFFFPTWARDSYVGHLKKRRQHVIFLVKLIDNLFEVKIHCLFMHK